MIMLSSLKLPLTLNSFFNLEVKVLKSESAPVYPSIMVMGLPLRFSYLQTSQKDYRNKELLNYISTFSGYFPAENPKYSCIVVIHEPDKTVGYYGADVSGPVFKKIAQKIYTSAPVLDVIDNINQKSLAVEEQYQNYFSTSEKYKTVMPNLKGLPAMDAIAILENMGLQVKIVGQGKVKKQSINRGEKVVPKTTVILELS